MAEVKRYKKKPVEILALELVADPTPEDVDILHEFLLGATWYCEDDGIYIETLEGDFHVSEGDFIIKGVKGEFYPCKPDIFKLTYEMIQ